MHAHAHNASKGTPNDIPNGFHDDQPPQAPFIAQAFLKGLIDHIERRAKCDHELQQRCQDAGITEDDPAMEHYMLATQQLNVAQQRVTSVEQPLAWAVYHLEAFKAAMDQNTRIGVETPSGKLGSYIVTV